MPMTKLASKNIILSNEYTEWKFDVNGNLLSIDQEPASIKFIQYPTDTTTDLKGMHINGDLCLKQGIFCCVKHLRLWIITTIVVLLVNWFCGTKMVA